MKKKKMKKTAISVEYFLMQRISYQGNETSVGRLFIFQTKQNNKEKSSLHSRTSNDINI